MRHNKMKQATAQSTSCKAASQISAFSKAEISLSEEHYWNNTEIGKLQSGTLISVCFHTLRPFTVSKNGEKP